MRCDRVLCRKLAEYAAKMAWYALVTTPRRRRKLAAYARSHSRLYAAVMNQLGETVEDAKKRRCPFCGREVRYRLGLEYHLRHSPFCMAALKSLVEAAVQDYLSARG